MNSITTKHMVLTALITAIICCIGPITLVLPVSPIPISLASLALYLACYLLGCRRAVLSCFLYLLIGTVGIPVFSGFGAGPAKLFGPTGGYLFGYLLMTYISGWFIEKNRTSIFMQLFGTILGTMSCYLLGTLWLSFQSQITPLAALMVGVLPFLPGDIIKICISCILGRTLYKRLLLANVW